MDLVEPIDLVFENLSYTVTDKVQSKILKKDIKKCILNNLTGYFSHGRLTGIMGPSGAGKTSLMEIISGQSKSGNVTGNLYLNGNPTDINAIKKRAGFVFQDDVILKTMTVKEALYMSALLRLPENISNEEKLNKVNYMISILHLENCKITIIGDSIIKGISGGERKRLSVGMEMIMNPSIIFLDEPTSGLDTYTAYSLIKNLKDLTNEGRTVVSTIHQPSSDILRLFDDLIILNYGKIVYQGEVSNLVNYFSNIGYKCPEYTNPSDYLFMKILNPIVVDDNINDSKNNIQNNNDNNIDNNTIENNLLNNIENNNLEEKNKYILDCYSNSGMKKNIIDKCNLINSNQIILSEKSEKYKPSFCLQLVFLLKRNLKNIIRDKAILRTRIGQAFGLGIIVGLSFLNIPKRDAKAQIQDRNGSLFIAALSQVLLPVIGTLSLFSIERPVIMREVSSGYYEIFSYYLSKMIIEIPLQIIITFITCTIIYWLCLFQNTFKKYIIFIGIIELGSLFGVSLGTAIASAAKNINVALQFGPFIIIPFILFSGLLINTDSIPIYFTWIQYISPIRYMYQEVYKNEFKGLYYKGQSLEHYIEEMNFNSISTTLAVVLLGVIAILLLIISYLILFCSIKRSLSKTKYYLNTNDLNHLNIKEDKNIYE